MTHRCEQSRVHYDSDPSTTVDEGVVDQHDPRTGTRIQNEAAHWQGIAGLDGVYTFPSNTYVCSRNDRRDCNYQNSFDGLLGAGGVRVRLYIHTLGKPGGEASRSCCHSIRSCPPCRIQKERQPRKLTFSIHT